MSTLDKAKNVRTLEWEDLDANTLGGAGEVVRKVPFWQGKFLVGLVFCLTFAMLATAAFCRVGAERSSEASYRLDLFSKDLQGLIEMEGQARMKAILAGKVQFGSIEDVVRLADVEDARAIGEEWTDIRRGALVLSVDVNQIKALQKKVDSAHDKYSASYASAKRADAWWQMGAFLSGFVVLATAFSASNKRATTLLVQSVVARQARDGRGDSHAKPRSAREPLDLPLAYCRTREDGTVSEWGSRMKDIFGVEADRAIGSQVADLVGWQEHGEIAKGTLNRLNSGEPIYGLTWDFSHPSGMQVKIKADLAPARDRTGAIVGSVCVFTDETAWHRQSEKLVDAEVVKKAMVDALEDSVLRFGARGELIEAVDKAGLFPGNVNGYLGTGWQQVFPAELNSRIAQSFKHCRINRSANHFRFEWQTMAGVRHLEFRIANCGLAEVLAVVRDSTEEHILREELAGQIELTNKAHNLLVQSSRSDGLTGLLNHQALTEFLEVGLRYAKSAAEPISVVCFDIDDFNQLNIDHGYAVGDAVLKRFGALLLEGMGENDRAFRIGGEEFYLILPQVGMDQAEGLSAELGQKVEAGLIEGLRVAVTTAVTQLGPDSGSVRDVLAECARQVKEKRAASRNLAA